MKNKKYCIFPFILELCVLFKTFAYPKVMKIFFYAFF